MVMNPARLEAAEALHARIANTLAHQRENEHRLAQDLHAMNVGRLYTELGCASLREYGERYHRLSPAQTRMFVTIGNRIEALPSLGDALKSGRIGSAIARRLAKVVTEDNVNNWLTYSEAATSRELARLVRHAAPGDSVARAQQKEAEADDLVRIVMCDVPPDMKNLFVRALAIERELAGVSSEDCTDVEALCRILQDYMHRVTERDDHDIPAHASRYMKVVHVDADDVPLESEGYVDDTDVQMASCDATVVDMSLGPNRGRISQTIPASTKRAVLLRDRYRCCVGGCENWRWLDIHHVTPRYQGGTNDERNLLTLCGTHHRTHHKGGLAVEHAGHGEVRVTEKAGQRTVIATEEPISQTSRASRDARRELATE